jgi:hypothetical protein
MGPGKHCIANENVMTSQHTQTNLVLRSLAKWLLPVNLSLCVTASNALTIASAAAFTFSWWLLVQTFLFAVVVLLACYSLRHYLFTCQRLYGKQLHRHTARTLAECGDLCGCAQ